jgi:stage IV sporulation protein FB
LNFRLFNIPVYIHPSFWIFLLFFSNIYRDPSAESVIWGVVLIFSLLVHEYGHALTALYFGAKPEITLEAFGGNARYNGFRITPKQRFLITLNGPLLESVLIALSYVLLKLDIFENPHIRYFLYVMMRLNILWCLLNLIPIAPLDGGHILRYLLERKFGEKGYKASIVIGLISVAVAAPYLFYRDLFFFGTLLLIFGVQNFQVLKQGSFSSSADNGFSSYVKGIEAIKNDDLENAKAILRKLLKSKDAKIQSLASESLATAYVQENQDQKAYELLLKTDPQFLKEGKCLLCRLAFERTNYELVSKYSRDIYDIAPSFEIAVLNSKTFAYLNHPVLSGGWLETASQFDNISLKDIEVILQDRAYDSVREQDVFKQYVEKIQSYFSALSKL